MRSFIILAVVALLASVGYGIHRNPNACEKLALDVLSDALAIYVTPVGADKAVSNETQPSREAAASSSADAASTAQSLTPVRPISAAPALPVVMPGTSAPTTTVAPVVTVNPAAANIPTNAPVTAAPPKPQYSVGYVATLPINAAATPVPVPAPLAAGEPSHATQYPTYVDYDSGLQAARKYHVPMLVLFTGSDWCHYCQMLEQEVLSSSDFTKYTGSHFVFVTIDDLRNSPVSDSDKSRITGLEQKFNVTGFPTLMVVDNSEHEVGRQEGYDPGSGPKAVIQSLDPYATPR